MSDPVVIDIFRNRLSTLPSSPMVPYIDTLNVRPASLPDTFIGLERDISSVARVNIGRPAQFREIGTLLVVVSVRAGAGIEAAADISEMVRDAFHDYALLHFQVLVVDSATPVAPDDGSYFQFKVPVQYQFDFFK